MAERQDLPADPLELFERWQGQARGDLIGGAGAFGRALRGLLRWLWQLLGWLLGSGELPRADAAALATTTAEGHPSVRMVLVKSASSRGFVFYTNYESRKARELEETGSAALVFYWPLPPRQVRVEGTIERLSRDESDRYFRSRPRGSQIGAWASRQSAPLEAVETLKAAVEAHERRFRGREVPRPERWGGYRLIPRRLELWQGRPDRLHERLLYVATGDEARPWEPPIRLQP